MWYSFHKDFMRIQMVIPNYLKYNETKNLLDFA
jgi:hypothetical protein